MSKLIDGQIPSHTECPFKKECTLTFCQHKGIEHKTNFSCGFARLFDILELPSKSKINDGA